MKVWNQVGAVQLFTSRITHTARALKLSRLVGAFERPFVQQVSKNGVLYSARVILTAGAFKRRIPSGQ